MTEASIAEIARRQLADYDAHRPGQVFQDPTFTLTIPEAFAVQRQVAALREMRGEAVAGYKIGCLSEAVQGQLGIERPVFGHLFATQLYRSGAVFDAALFDCLAIEGEFAVRVGPDLSIASVFAVIELHNNVFRGAARTAPELIANNALHAGVVLPRLESPYPELTMLEEETISVLRNGVLLGSAKSGAIPGGPRASVAKVAGHLASVGSTLKPNQVVLTGSPLPLYPVYSGDHIVVRCTQLTEVELSVRGEAV